MTLSTARSNRVQNGAILTGSLAAHALVLALLALPRIEAFADRSNDEGALTVTLERVVAPALTARPAAAARDNPLRALQPRLPRAMVRSPVAPLLVPGLSTAPPRGAAHHPAPGLEGAKGDLRSALRSSSVGCANRAAVGLNRREIETCNERWGAAARTAPVYANVPRSARASAEFDQQAARQAADLRYKAAPMGPGIDHRSRDGPGQAKSIPFVMGDTDGLGRKKSDQSLGIKP